MSHCSINLEDVDGEIKMMVRHTDGFDPHSPAHKMSSQIIKFLEEQATSKRDISPGVAPIIYDRPLVILPR